MDKKDLDRFFHDNGFTSRKFWVVVGSILLVAVMGVLWGVYKWEEGLFSTITSSIVTLAIAFIGINAGRAAIPAVAALVKRKEAEEKSQDDKR